jgi:hypothetical protein
LLIGGGLRGEVNERCCRLEYNWIFSSTQPSRLLAAFHRRNPFNSRSRGAFECCLAPASDVRQDLVFGLVALKMIGGCCSVSNGVPTNFNTLFSADLFLI